MVTHPVAQKDTHSVDDWVEKLRAQELPIFSNTAQNLHRSLNDAHKGAMDLATIILQDPNLTAKLLIMGNTPYYNPSRQKVSTVSRAIILLGAEVIRELTLACSFFESILSTDNKERANREIAQAIHAAVQAKELAILLKDNAPEEIFVATLLHNIGHIAFWCSNSKQAVQIIELIEKNKIDAHQAEKAVLGFTMAELSRKLCKSWHLGGLIEESNSRSSMNKRTEIVHLGSEISEALTLGWESEAFNVCLKKLQLMSGEQPEKLISKIQKNTEVAIKIARQFGAHDASKFISNEVIVTTDEDICDFKHDKKQIQFQILQDISNHISGEIDVNRLFEMVLEGIYRGVEMDRTLFLMLSPDKKTLNEKISMGWNKAIGSEKIQIFNNETDSNLFFYALQHEEGLWAERQKFQFLYTAQIVRVIGYSPCFIFPIFIQHNPIGLIYADRGISQLALTQTDYSAAKHFARQANIGLTLYTVKRH